MNLVAMMSTALCRVLSRWVVVPQEAPELLRCKEVEQGSLTCLSWTTCLHWTTCWVEQRAFKKSRRGHLCVPAAWTSCHCKRKRVTFLDYQLFDVHKTQEMFYLTTCGFNDASIQAWHGYQHLHKHCLYCLPNPGAHSPLKAFAKGSSERILQQTFVWALGFLV